jgi:hypothetical protein
MGVRTLGVAYIGLSQESHGGFSTGPLGFEKQGVCFHIVDDLSC